MQALRKGKEMKIKLLLIEILLFILNLPFMLDGSKVAIFVGGMLFGFIYFLIIKLIAERF